MSAGMAQSRLWPLLLCLFFASVFLPRCRAQDTIPYQHCQQYVHRGIFYTVKRYTCCNNCLADKEECDSETFTLGRKKNEKKPCGMCGTLEDSDVEPIPLMKGDPFYCGGCKNQMVCEACADNELKKEIHPVKRCARKRWADRFQTCCTTKGGCDVAFGGDSPVKKSATMNIQTEVSNMTADICGDGICSTTERESNKRCPFDCCPSLNPENCTTPGEACPTGCCSEPDCCLGGAGAYVSGVAPAASPVHQWCSLLIVMAVWIAL